MAEKTFFEEMSARDGSARDAYVDVATWLEALPDGQLAVKLEEAELLFGGWVLRFWSMGVKAATNALSRSI